MTQEEQELSPQDLISRLQTPTTQEQEEVVAEQPVQPNTVREINGKGIRGTYTLKAKEDGGYELKEDFAVYYNNQAAQAFRKGLTTKSGLVNVEPDNNGLYNFRGIVSGTYNTLSAIVRVRSQEIAGYTAIYQDLQAKQSSGDTLTAEEEKFMSDYNILLEKSGLQMNANGELEDIPTKKSRRKN